MANAKRKNSNLGVILMLVTAILAAVGILSMLMSYYSASVSGSNSTGSMAVSGFTLAWGGQVVTTIKSGSTTNTSNSELGNTNAGLIVLFVLFVLAAVLAIVAIVLNSLKIKKIIVKIVLVVSGLALLAAGIMAFCTLPMIAGETESLDAGLDLLAALGAKVNRGLGFGAILGGIVGILGCGSAVAGVVLDK